MKPSLVRIVLVSLLLAVQLATVAIVVMGMRNQTDEHIGAVAQRSLSQFSEQVGQRLSRLTDSAEQAIATGRSLISGGVLDARADDAVVRFLVAQLQALPELARMQLVRSDGSMVQVERQAEGYRSQVVSVPSSQQPGERQVKLAELSPQLETVRQWVSPNRLSNPRLTQWYANARQSSRPLWTGLGGAVDGEQSAGQGSGFLTLASVTSHPDTTDAGVLSASISTRAVAAQFGGALLPGNSTVALADANGNTLAYLGGPDLTTTFDPDSIRSLDVVAQAPIRQLLGQLNIDLINESSAVERWQQNSGFSELTASGQDYFGAATPVTAGGGQMTWLLAATVPASSFTGNLDELYKRKLRTLLAVILIPAIIAVLALFGLNDPAPDNKEETDFDELTGFLNRAEFRRRLEGMLRNRREHEYGGRIVVATLDMDGYGNLVSRYGRDTGDAVIRQFARRLRQRVRQYDLLGRTEPDKFQVALRVDRGADVLTTVNRIRRATVVKPFVTSSGRHMLGVTAGVAAVDPNETVDDLIARADQALVTGKVRNRNRTYLAAAPDTGWPQTAVALPDQSATKTKQEAEKGKQGDGRQPPDQRSPTLEI